MVISVHGALLVPQGGSELKSPIFNPKLFVTFLDYGEADWRKLTTQNLDNVECYHDEVKKNFGATLDWYDILFIFQSFFKSFFFQFLSKISLVIKIWRNI